MVTKQEQLEWLAKRFESLPFGSDSILMSDKVLGHMGDEYKITNQELKRERDKMSSEPEVDNSWRERGEFPPVGTICEMIDDKNTWLECDVISHKDGSCIGWIPSRKSPFYTYDKSEFRPLRTEREKAIDEMLLAIDHIKEGNFETFIGALYDAGYRKVNNK